MTVFLLRTLRHGERPWLVHIRRRIHEAAHVSDIQSQNKAATNILQNTSVMFHWPWSHSAGMELQQLANASVAKYELASASAPLALKVLGGG